MVLLLVCRGSTDSMESFLEWCKNVSEDALKELVGAINFANGRGGGTGHK